MADRDPSDTWSVSCLDPLGVRQGADRLLQSCRAAVVSQAGPGSKGFNSAIIQPNDLKFGIENGLLHLSLAMEHVFHRGLPEVTLHDMMDFRTSVVWAVTFFMLMADITTANGRPTKHCELSHNTGQRTCYMMDSLTSVIYYHVMGGLNWIVRESLGIRLVGGSEVHEGRLEVFHDGEWGTVCDDGFDRRDGNVACRQLGFSGVEKYDVYAFDTYGKMVSAPIILDDLQCTGNESRLQNCTHNGLVRLNGSGPCDNYTRLNESWRNIGQVNDGEQNKCDSGFETKWYRFMEPAGFSMPEEAPPSKNRCGTDWPMWMDGQHPNITEGTVIRTVCAYRGNESYNRCRYSQDIEVRACRAGFFVYKLRRPPYDYCNLAYCAETKDIDACAVFDPCVHGSCVDGINNFTCNCHQGYAGHRCDTDFNACSMCHENATCIDNPAPALDANCTCKAGYFGDGLVNGTGCTDINACVANPCHANATCTDNPAPALDASCSCNTGLTGDGLANGTGCSAIEVAEHSNYPRPPESMTRV
ncbi:Mucin-4 [Branchiostoma belcheri]|nr:Mucin-4 [Branchiostoma belcheri]